ncbi:MAG: ROK family protein [Gammaproteobacteria bacterium]|nr:ROK family protein [Gammaproteobacteria bacterium]
MTADPLWGIDLGGTKIEILVLDSGSNEVMCRQRIDTEKEQGRSHILDRIKKLVHATSKKLDRRPDRIGIATPGTLDPVTGLLKNSNTVCLNNTPLKRDIEKLLQVPVVLANDANCFALAETQLGIIQDEFPHAEVVFGIILGTGVGGGVVVDGKVIGGIHGIGGEWGHMQLDPHGEACYCGDIGCVETIISGPALEQFYTGITGQSLPLQEIAKREASDPHAAETIERLLSNFGRALSQVLNVLDPDAIVIGGGVGNIDALYEERCIEAINKGLFNHAFHGRLLKPALGDSAGVFGAAMLVNDKF